MLNISLDRAATTAWSAPQLASASVCVHSRSGPAVHWVQVGYAITTLPDDFHTHRRIKKVYDERRHMVESGEGVDWGMAEALAFGTLLAEGQQFLAFVEATAFS